MIANHNKRNFFRYLVSISKIEINAINEISFLDNNLLKMINSKPHYHISNHAAGKTMVEQDRVLLSASSGWSLLNDILLVKTISSDQNQPGI